LWGINIPFSEKTKPFILKKYGQAVVTECEGRYCSPMLEKKPIKPQDAAYAKLNFLPAPQPERPLPDVKPQGAANAELNFLPAPQPKPPSPAAVRKEISLGNQGRQHKSICWSLFLIIAQSSLMVACYVILTRYFSNKYRGTTNLFSHPKINQLPAPTKPLHLNKLGY